MGAIFVQKQKLEDDLWLCLSTLHNKAKEISKCWVLLEGLFLRFKMWFWLLVLITVLAKTKRVLPFAVTLVISVDF